MGEIRQSCPLFPLSLVLLPGERIPLHIFEERYKTMIGQCLEAGTEFGILWVGDDGLRDVGCSARVEEVLERTDDGRMNIVALGTDPFRLQRKIEELEYPAGDIELLDEPAEDPDATALQAARDSYSRLVQRVTDDVPNAEDVAGLSAYDMAATIAFDLPDKQSLLELRSETDRLNRLAFLCDAAIERLDHAEKAAERASGNGRVQH